MALLFLALIIGIGGPFLLIALAYLICRFGMSGVIVMGLIFVVLLTVASWVDILFGAMTLATIYAFLVPFIHEE